MLNFTRHLFSKLGLFVVIYTLIGVFANTAAPHLPNTAHFDVAMLHSWIQYFISIVLWPLSFWHPAFTVAKWTGH